MNQVGRFCNIHKDSFYEVEILYHKFFKTEYHLCSEATDEAKNTASKSQALVLCISSAFPASTDR